MTVAPGLRVPFLDLAAGAGPEVHAAFARVVAGGRWILGPEVDAFEREFAAFCGVGHAVGVASGTDAVQLVLRALGIGAGDEVLVPGQTAVATWMAVSLTGATPVGVDVDPAAMTIDPAHLEAARTPRTRAVLPVHLAGRVADMEGIGAWAAERGIVVVEDAAQAHGATWRGRRTGGLARAAAFSFYPTKNLGAVGDGGAVTTDDAALAARVRRLRQYGWDESRNAQVVGLNSRLDEVQAAILRERLAVLDLAAARRRQIADRYLAGLAGVPGLELPADDPGHAWHLFVVRHRERDALRGRLAHEGVGTLVHYDPAPHLNTAYRGSARLPVTERLAATVLSLPLHPQLADDAVDHVVAAVRSAAASL